MNKSDIRLAEVILENMETDDRAHVALQRGLNFLMEVQETTSNLVDNAIPASGHSPTPEQIRTYFLAMIGETYELMNETNWKPWKKTLKPVDRTKMADEFADILAFLGVITVYMERLGITPEMLAKAYIEKTKINVGRFLGSY